VSSKQHDTSRIDEAWVTQTAALAGLDIPRERLADVIATLQRIEQLARHVNETPLSAADDPAPVWKP
jgi:Asp-tRNA(Asn)/Glu-tRNA(Gln) amidotransferase C subunit